MFLRQGSRSITTTAAMHAHRSSSSHMASAIDQSQPPVSSHDAALTVNAPLNREAQAPSTVVHISHADTEAAAHALQSEVDGIVALRSQPEPAAPSERRTSRPQTRTGVASQIRESPQAATQASSEEDAATQGMSVEPQHMAQPAQGPSGTAHAPETPQDPPGEVQPGDWREQQQRWLETPSGLAEAAGLDVEPGSHTGTVPASRAQSVMGLDNRPPSLGHHQQRQSLNLIKVSVPATSLMWLGS